MDTRATVIEIIHTALRSLNDELPANKRVPVAAETRLFGPDALLDSLSIFENLAFPLREHTKLRTDEISAKVSRQLAVVGLAGV